MARLDGADIDGSIPGSTAKAAVRIASDEALVTGRRIAVTGGQSLRRVPLPVDFS